ncbi:putative fasciclin-like arabinogalactan protein 20 [Malania oleifera]|uniref:putative fasciclin-like arabinogalactan protein 20 n=1 Tax=Malania oleifera TaxID=397392 RepID=UPI0025AE12E0|nr:putative fasciclin-like arabinogalactan protein 20 [Malania oleifera]
MATLTSFLFSLFLLSLLSSSAVLLPENFSNCILFFSRPYIRRASAFLVLCHCMKKLLQTMATLTSFLFSLFLLSLLSSSAVLLPETFRNATQTLSDSGFLSMALTLQLASPTLLLNSSPAATIFAPSDAAFLLSGQPSLLLLQFHISPLRLHPQNLSALPPGATIPTLLLNHSLIVTAPSDGVDFTINNVKIEDSPVYDDGSSMVIYGIEEFFNSSFVMHQNLAPASTPGSMVSDLLWSDPSGSGAGFFDLVSDLLRSRGYSRMATFLDMQLVGFVNYTGLTIFAPVDEAIDEAVKNFGDFSVFFRRHVVPNCLTWLELAELDSGTILQTFSEGFVINVTRSGDVLELNGLPVIFPDMYYRDALVVHGINRLLTEKQELTGDSFFQFDWDDDPDPPDYGNPNREADRTPCR